MREVLRLQPSCSGREGRNSGSALSTYLGKRRRGDMVILRVQAVLLLNGISFHHLPLS